MADSLRDQLIAAGYEAPKKEEKRKPRNNNASGKKNNKSAANSKNRNKPQGKRPPAKSQQSRDARGRNSQGKTTAEQEAEAQKAIEERKKLKAQIKTLIDDNKVADWKGEVAYRYLVEKKIRELYVTEALHKQLAERDIAITRLNGDTFLVPHATALSIKEINPQWSVFNIDADTEEEAKIKSSEAEYADYKVPDDLKW